MNMQIYTTIDFAKEIPETYEDPFFWGAWCGLNTIMKIEVNVSERKQDFFLILFITFLLSFK